MTEAAASSRHRPSRPSAATPTAAMPPTVLSPRLRSPHHRNAPAPKSPSPNYFGLPAGESFLTDSGQHARQNWSPPGSSVRSAAALSPSLVPLDQNSDYEAFRRQSEGKSTITLNGFPGFGQSASRLMPIAAKRSSGGQQPARDGVRVRQEPVMNAPSPQRPLGKSDSLEPSSQSPKRVLSPGSLTLPDSARRGSPAGFSSPDSGRTRTDSSSPDSGVNGFFNNPVSRAETMPASPDADGDGGLMKTAQHVVTLIQSSHDQILMLDLRVSTQYAKSHIEGALSLCIPTTLLKRPSFNVQKLAETFKDDAQRARFAGWRKSKYIIVYDASSSQAKDAQICTNTIKKFRAEGYQGNAYILKGGFADFSRRFPKYVEAGVDSPSSSSSSLNGLDPHGPKVAPVVGGCPMPGTDKPANPFFGNIRQNMDLIGGVGQIPLKHPAKSTAVNGRRFPSWLREAAEDRDQGKQVASKFEAIERREKKRMEDALSGQVSYGTPRAAGVEPLVQIAGIEKGNKNRYNNIWPFEHSRVKLQGVPSSGCDYFNANHIRAGWSNKRYISTQAPIPATFADFWNVVWQQDVRVIVMLTAEKEGAQVKAHNYWNQRQYGPLHLDFLSEKRASLELEKISRHKKRPSNLKRASNTMSSVPLAQIDPSESKGGDQPYVVVRRFTLSHDGHPFARMREITQLQYSSWPDFGAPADPAHLLGLVEQCDAVVRVTERTRSNEPQPPSPRPILVHCSAGCGRTGTFCTVDSVIDMLKRQRLSKLERANRQGTPMDIDPKPHKRRSDHGGFFASQFQKHDGDDEVEGKWVERDDQDLIEKTVEDFRHQRISMVQSLRQYVLCYESVMQWLVEQEAESA